MSHKKIHPVADENRTRVKSSQQRTSRSRPNLWLFVAGVLSVLLFTYLTYGIISSYMEVLYLNRQIAEVHSEIEQEEEIQEKLRSEMDLLQDPDYIEIRAREQLGLIRPGDVPLKWR